MSLSGSIGGAIHGAWRNKAFCGGMHDVHRWLEKDDILALIKALGFADIRYRT